MSKKEDFIMLTGEDPEDMFGPDWEKVINETIERDCMRCEKTFTTTNKKNEDFCKNCK